MRLADDDMELSYESPSARRKFNLEGGVAFGAGNALRGLKWSYTLGYRSVTGISRGAREASVDVDVTDFTLWDEMCRAWQADVTQLTPGTVWSKAVDGSLWEAKAYVLVSDPSDVKPLVRMTTKLTLVLVEGVWRHASPYQFMPISRSKGVDLDYPYDFKHDYGPSSITGVASNKSLVSCPVSLTFYGPVANPSVAMGGNLYQVKQSVPAGGYLVVDGLEHTVTMTTSTGVVTNEFEHAMRGDGQGTGNYIFEPLPPGDITVGWDGSYGLDLTIFDEEGAPPWMS